MQGLQRKWKMMDHRVAALERMEERGTTSASAVLSCAPLNGNTAADQASKSRRIPSVLVSFVAGLISLLWLDDPAGASLSAPGEVAEKRRSECPAVVAQHTSTAWMAYRANDLGRAERLFASAMERCPGDVGARVGLGYTAYRRGEFAAGRRMFEAVLNEHPDVVDALIGAGMVAWRTGAVEAAGQFFQRVLALEPEHPEALEYVARISGAASSVAKVPQRTPLVLPDTVVFPARVAGDRFEVRGPAGWLPFYVKGVNLGAATPGKFPSEFPDSVTYYQWLEQIGAMGANAIRTYTMHPPHFYGALREFNLQNPGNPLWLIQGVWAELPPEDVVYDDPAWEAEFFQDIRRVVDIIHGRADIPARAGRASGHYTANVSQWTLAFILGREWESHSVAGYNEIRPDLTSWSGTYLRVSDATAMDVWLARAADAAVSYEMRQYRAQRPIAYTNWPTTDPLRHPSESTVMEEAAIRRSFGEDFTIRPVLEGDDAVSLDPSLVEPTAAFPAGYFASYHVYPYYPDFMVFSREYNEAASPWGRSNYWGYLVDLKRHHADLPVLVAEYGVPTSIGIAHLQPQGWNHGGNSEARAAEITARLTREIAASGMAGGIAFAWIDEWFKRTWNTAEFELPADRGRLWYNRFDAEEHYGIVALEPEEKIRGATLSERRSIWENVAPLYENQEGGSLRALADEAYLRILFVPGSAGSPDELFLGFDVFGHDLGDVQWPGRVGPGSPVGMEFVLKLTPDEARLVVDPTFNPTRVRSLDARVRGIPTDGPHFEWVPPGFFRGRYSRELRSPLLTRWNEDGVYDSLQVITSRMRYGRDSVVYAATGYDLGVLPRGPLPDGLWERASDGALEIRIPWQLLNFSDPSQRRVLQDVATESRQNGTLGTAAVEGIRIVALSSVNGSWLSFPTSGSLKDVPLFTWDAWEEPRWQARVRPVYHELRLTWADLATPVLEDKRASR